MSRVDLDWLRPGVARLTMNDPEKLNAMGLEMAADFAARVDELRGQSLRAVVLTGSGRAFSAGGVLQMLQDKQKLGLEENRREMLKFYRSFLGVLDLEVPVVAAVNGLAVGAGFCLTCACDLRVADPAARFSAPFLKLGLYPGMGGTWFVPRVLGPHAGDVLLTGRMLDAPTALSLGLVTRLCEPGQVAELAAEMAESLGAGEATRDLLRTMRGPRDQLQTALQREAEAQARSYGRAEFAEGLAAALEKRPPRF